ncbi:hypothetical protein [Microbacterium sp. ZW T5_56]|uniref:hypothetical protein n=1 Tax=Microbacterium sp. ZW T5_56 TaxID=3378081 RepID=UPI0038527605
MSLSFPDSPQPLVSLGQIHATADTVITPAGSWPLAQVNVTTRDQTSTTTHTPGWAIVLTVVLIWFFLLSLLFLLARERRVTGTVAVTVTAANGQSFTDNIPVGNDFQRHDLFNRVAYLQSLIGAERQRTAY